MWSSRDFDLDACWNTSCSPDVSTRCCRMALTYWEAASSARACRWLVCRKYILTVKMALNFARRMANWSSATGGSRNTMSCARMNLVICQRITLHRILSSSPMPACICESLPRTLSTADPTGHPRPCHSARRVCCDPQQATYTGSTVGEGWEVKQSDMTPFTVQFSS